MEDHAGTNAAGGRGWHRGWMVMGAVAAAFAVAFAVAFAAFVVAVPAFAEDPPGRDPQVVGGDGVPNGKYPFMASLQYDRANTSGYRDHFCGGTLISPRYVLTAAHCAEVIGVRGGVPVQRLKVVVGTTVLSGDAGQARGIERRADVKIHPRYRATQRGLLYDAAVIRLDGPVNGVRPMTLDAAGSNALDSPGRPATITGWGNTTAQPPNPEAGGNFRYPNRMREATVPVASDASMRDAYGAGFVPRIMVGAGRKKEGACYGDSGGPLFVSTGAGLRQIGITSFGVGCATARYRGVFAEVSSPPINGFIRRAAGVS